MVVLSGFKDNPLQRCIHVITKLRLCLGGKMPQTYILQTITYNNYTNYLLNIFANTQGIFHIYLPMCMYYFYMY